MQPKILIIGAKDHDRADCFDWQQPFPNIEEYDSIIINLQSLTQALYDKILIKIVGMKESITTVLSTNREIFCIMNRLIRPSPSPSPPGTAIKRTIRADYVSPTNYDWLPAKIGVNNQKTGKSINVYNHRFDTYLEFVDRWNLEIGISYGKKPIEHLAALCYRIDPIAMNKSKKTIAGSLKAVNFLTGEVLKGYGFIHLLPPPTKCNIHQAIEIILDIICGEKVKKVPPWRKDIEVPKIKEFEQKIEKKITVIKRIQQEISQLGNQMQEWDSYRDLLTETGIILEDIVRRTLADINIKTEKTEKGFPADLISNEVAVEITGVKGCVGVGSEKVIQTGRFKELYHKGEKIILIANTYMDLPPRDRIGKMDFSPEVKKYFESLSICCLTTMTLFQLWKDVVIGKRGSEDIKRKILTKNGELTLSEFE